MTPPSPDTTTASGIPLHDLEEKLLVWIHRYTPGQSGSFLLYVKRSLRSSPYSSVTNSELVEILKDLERRKLFTDPKRIPDNRGTAPTQTEIGL